LVLLIQCNGLGYITFAVDVVVGTLARVDRVQMFAAIFTLVTLAVPRPSTSQHGLGSVDVASATGTSFTFGCLAHRFGCLRAIGYGVGVAELGTGIHAERTGSAAESVTFGSEFTAVAVAAEQLVLVLVGVGRVQHFVAQVALEALFVEFQSSGDALFSGVDGLGAERALGDIGGYERHRGNSSVLAVGGKVRKDSS